jgi:hypothetical protein
MIKKLAPVLAAVAAAAMLFAGSASAATHSKPRTIGSCHAKGRHAHCDAKGTAKHPSSLWLHVRAQPDQKVVVGWADICKKGSHKSTKDGGFIAKADPTLNRKMKMGYKHPASCIAAVVGGLTTKGKSIRVWITVGN